MSWLLKWLDRLARPVPLVLLFACIAVWRTLMQTTLDRLRDVSGQSILDYEILYSRERVLEVFTAYGDEGMRLYGRFMALDLAFPALYGLFFASLIHLGVRGSGLRLVVLAPLLMALFDYVENAGFYWLLRTFPDISGTAVAAANGMTLLKFGFGALSIVAGLIAGYQFLRARRRP